MDFFDAEMETVSSETSLRLYSWSLCHIAVGLIGLVQPLASFIQLIGCLTTGPKFLPKRAI